VGRIVQEATEVLRPEEQLNFNDLVRTFTLRSSEGFVENFGPEWIARVAEKAPGVRLFFVQKPNKDSAPLRDGLVDLETGIIEKTTAPELRVQALFRDRYIGVVRAGHPLSQGAITPARYADGQHISVSRLGLDKGPIDETLGELGLTRKIVTVVAGFSTALSLARASDMVASVPGRHTRNLRSGMFSFPLPVNTQEITISMLWHPRMDGDAAHRWIRGCLHAICAAQHGDSASPEELVKE
jgi:DNA-binding transcriptional LysR family regulator